MTRTKRPYLPTYCGRQSPGSVPHLPTYSQAAAKRKKMKIAGTYLDCRALLGETRPTYLPILEGPASGYRPPIRLGAGTLLLFAAAASQLLLSVWEETEGGAERA